MGVQGGAMGRWRQMMAPTNAIEYAETVKYKYVK
jgi:hypothetical protein